MVLANARLIEAISIENHRGMSRCPERERWRWNELAENAAVFRNCEYFASRFSHGVGFEYFTIPGLPLPIGSFRHRTVTFTKHNFWTANPPQDQSMVSEKGQILTTDRAMFLCRFQDLSEGLFTDPVPESEISLELEPQQNLAGVIKTGCWFRYPHDLV
jgi:hypothetical protein